MKNKKSAVKTILLLSLAAVTATMTAACGSASEKPSETTAKAQLSAARTVNAPAEAKTAEAVQTAAQKPGQKSAFATTAPDPTTHETKETGSDLQSVVGTVYNDDAADSVDDTVSADDVDDADALDNGDEEVTEADETDNTDVFEETGEDEDESAEPYLSLSDLEGGMWFVYGFGHPDFTTYEFDGDTVTITRYATWLGETWEYRRYGEPMTIPYDVTESGVVIGDITLNLTEDENRLRVTREDPYNHYNDIKRYFEDFAYRHSDLPTEEELRAESAENLAAETFRPME